MSMINAVLTKFQQNQEFYTELQKISYEKNGHKKVKYYLNVNHYYYKLCGGFANFHILAIR